MRICAPLRRSRSFGLRLGLPLVVWSALALWVVAPASADQHKGTQYVLKVVEGETTLPEYPIARIVGEVEPEAQVAVALDHNGITVYKTEEHDGSSSGSSQVPQSGDTLVLESPVGHVIASQVYDGMPTIDPSTCVGSTDFEGNNTSGFTVEGFYSVDTLEHPYHQWPREKQSDFQQAQVKTLTGTSFGGSFLAPVPAGATVAVKESLKTQLSSETTLTYESERQEPANKTCPAPPAPPPPPPAITPLQGALVDLRRGTIRQLLKSGWRDHVTINQAGTVTQDLFLRGGKLPVKASSVGRHHHTTPTDLLLARGSASASAAGTLSVLLKLTNAGKHKLHSATHIDAILVTTLRTAGGQIDTLSPHSLTLDR